MQSNVSPKKSPFKTRKDALGFLFGSPQENFDHLLPIKNKDVVNIDDSKPSSSFAETPVIIDVIKPSEHQVVRNWMFHYDLNRKSRHMSNDQKTKF